MELKMWINDKWVTLVDVDEPKSRMWFQEVATIVGEMLDIGMGKEDILNKLKSK